jgi:DNA invertase Pin-like site-specific DNA recombinase
MKQPTQVALYARVSTNEGRQHLDNQLIKMRDFVERASPAGRSMEVSAEYTDQESGGNPRRTGLDNLMRDAAWHQFDRVLVFDLSRLTREGPAAAFAYIERLAKSGVEFWSLTEEHFRTSGPAGDLFIAIAAFIAREERKTKSLRVRAGLERARGQGKKLGRPAVVLQGFVLARLRAQGLSIRQIATALQTSPSTIERRLRDNASS